MKKKLILWGSIIAAAMLFLLVVTLVIKAKIRKKVVKACTDGGGTWDKRNKRCVQPAPAPAPTPAPTQSGGGSSSNTSTTTTWSPNQLAAEISRNLEGWNFMVYTETAEKVLALNDAQLRVLYVYYNKNYAKDYPTITQLFENEWDDGLFSSTYDRVADRFRSIGLN